MASRNADIRPAVPSDGTDMGETHVLAWQVGYRGILPDAHLDGLDAEARGRFWHDHLSHRPNAADPMTPATAVADVDGRIVGMTTFGPYRPVDPADPDGTPAADRERFSELWSLNVHPDFWGTGVAQDLMTHILDQLKTTRPEPEVALWVLEGNARGRRFYEKEGWSADGQTKSEVFADHPIVELRYVKTL